MCISDSNKTLKFININNNEIKSNLYLPWEGGHLTHPNLCILFIA